MAGWDISQIARILQSMVQPSSSAAAARDPRITSQTTPSPTSTPGPSSRQPAAESTPQAPQDRVAVSTQGARQMAEALLSEIERALLPAAQSQAGPNTSAPPAAPLPAQAMATLLADEALRSQFEAWFSTSSGRQQLLALLHDSPIQAPLLRMLRHPAFTNLAIQLFANPQAQPLLRILLSQPSTQMDILALAANGRIAGQAAHALQPLPASEVLENLAAHPGGAALLGHLLRQVPEMRRAFLQNLAAFTDTSKLETLLLNPEILNQAQALLADAKSAKAFLELLAQPRLAEARNVLLSQTNLQPLLAALALSPNEQIQALKAIALLGPTTRSELLARRDIQNALVTILELSSNRETLEQTLHILNQPGSVAAANAILNHGAILARLPELLQNPGTRAIIVELLQKPEIQQIAARALESGPMVQILQNMLASPETRQVILQILSNPAAIAAARTVFRDEALANLLEEMALQRFTGAATSEIGLNALKILSHSSMAEHLQRLISNPRFQAILGDLLSRPASAESTLRLLLADSSPQALKLVLSALSGDPGTRPPGWLLASEQFQQLLSRLLAEPATRNEALYWVSSLSDFRFVRMIFAHPEVRAAFLQIILRAQPDDLPILGLLERMALIPSFHNSLYEILAVALNSPQASPGLQAWIKALLSRAVVPPAATGAPVPAQALQGALSPVIGAANAQTQANDQAFPTEARPSLQTAADAAAAVAAASRAAQPHPAAQDIADARPPLTGESPQAPYAFQPAPVMPWFGPIRFQSGSFPSPGQETGEESIPSFLDLIADEPLLLAYLPDELLIPGTFIPLILPPTPKTGEGGIFDAEILPG